MLFSIQYNWTFPASRRTSDPVLPFGFLTVPSGLKEQPRITRMRHESFVIISCNSCNSWREALRKWRLTVPLDEFKRCSLRSERASGRSRPTLSTEYKGADTVEELRKSLAYCKQAL